ncbi:MAG: TetR/AcrR family transcriptional regulator [Candidatus Cloacimonetes bacterium]|nr:TetR/AcrR family transcriptional regulator [Candidatus Cloacimonadota bacterium]
MEDKRTMIIAAARELIMHYGIRKTSIEDIAEACGLAKATLYHYFRGKDEICAEVIFTENQLLQQDIIKTVNAQTSVTDKLVVYICNRMKHFWELRSRYKYFFKEYYSMRSGINRIRESFYEFEESIVGEIISDLPVKAGAMNLLIQTLILGYELQIVQGTSWEELETSIPDSIELILHFDLGKTIQEDLNG